jgi:zinc and cadmium transporter
VPAPGTAQCGLKKTLMTLLLQIIAAIVATRALALAAGVVLSYRWLAKMSEELLAVACGLLVTVALTHILPEAFESETADAHALGLVMLVTIIAFLILERVVEALGGDRDSPRRSAAIAMMTGAALHNLVDGIFIASTFMVSPAAGWLVAFAVLCHEVPQTTGYMVILKNCGMDARRSFIWCAAAAMGAVLGGVLGWGAVSLSSGLLPYALAMSAASFLFITLHSLLPEVFSAHEGARGAMRQIALFLVGAALSLVLLGADHDHGHGAGGVPEQAAAEVQAPQR